MPGVENLLGHRPELAQLSGMLTETTGCAVAQRAVHEHDLTQRIVGAFFAKPRGARLLPEDVRRTRLWSSRYATWWWVAAHWMPNSVGVSSPWAVWGRLAL